MLLGARTNWVGLVSLILTTVFWGFRYIPPAWPYQVLVLGVLVTIGGSVLTALIAGIGGSRWWLLALLGPLVNGMFLLSLRT